MQINKGSLVAVFDLPLFGEPSSSSDDSSLGLVMGKQDEVYNVQLPNGHLAPIESKKMVFLADTVPADQAEDLICLNPRELLLKHLDQVVVSLARSGWAITSALTSGATGIL